MQEPADFPDRRGQLIRDFEHYLGILKAVHSGADLQASAKAAGHCLPSGAKGHLGYVLASLGSNQACPRLRLPAPSSTHAVAPRLNCRSDHDTVVDARWGRRRRPDIVFHIVSLPPNP